MPDYQKTLWVNGGPPGISAENLNKLETQYDCVKTELQRTDGLSAIQVHGSNLVAGSITAAKVAADIATQAELDAHTNATSAHDATSAATASRIMMRDANGRAKVAAPAAADDIARKDTVDGKFDPNTGHKHTGAAGDGPKIPLSSLETDFSLHAHNGQSGEGAVLPYWPTAFVAGGPLVHSHDAEASTSATSNTDLKRVYIPHYGSFTVKGKYKVDAGATGQISFWVGSTMPDEMSPISNITNTEYVEFTLTLEQFPLPGLDQVRTLAVKGRITAGAGKVYLKDLRFYATPVSIWKNEL